MTSEIRKNLIKTSNVFSIPDDDIMFDYLKDFNHDAYVFATDINREVTYSPGAVKAHATSLLENIVGDMLVKSGNKIVNPRVKFHMKVEKLYTFDIISYRFKNKLLSAYNLRSSIHDDLAKTKEREFDIALKLHRLLFDILWKYYEEFADEVYFKKPEYIEPTIKDDVEIDQTPQEIPDVIPERLFDRCIICGSPNNSKDSNFCRKCNNKLDNVEDLINMRNSLVDLSSFTVKDVRELGYSKEYSRQLVIELLNENLIYKKDKVYSLKEYEFESFLKCINEYFEINYLLTEFILGKYKLNQIKNTEIYKKGLDNIQPYTQVPKIVNEIIFKEFLNDVNLGVPIDDIINNTNITQNDIDEWFSNQIVDFKNHHVNNEFINYNLLLMEKYLVLKRNACKNSEILKILHITHDIVDFWKNSLKRQSQKFFNELKECEMDLILNALEQDKTKIESCNIADITIDDLNLMIESGKNGDELYESFYNVFYDSYYKQRREEFLIHLSNNDYDSAITISGLEKEEVDKWYESSAKDFAFGNRDINSFYIKTTKILMKNYVNARKLKKSQEESCKLINKNVYDIKRWLDIEEPLFIDFKNDLEDVLIKNVIDGFNDKKSVEEISKTFDISQNKIWKFIECGKNGEEKYVKIYEVYLDSYVVYQLNEFLVQIKIKPKHKVLKSLSISENEFDKYYRLGRNGDEKFKEFADEYYDFKINKYVNSMIKGRNQSKALRNADLSKEELADDIDERILNKQLEIVTDEIAKDKTTKQAAKKANISVDVVYDWFLKGRAGDEKFKDFAEFYYENYVEIGSNLVQEALEDGIPLKVILKKSKEHFTREDYDFWKKHNFLKKTYEINMDDKEELNEKLKKEILGDNYG